MTANYLEHVNITVKNPEDSAELLCRLFDWYIRWQGESLDVGRTVHVGNDTSYIAFYTQPDAVENGCESYATMRMTNHLAIVVDEFYLIRERVMEEGLKMGEIHLYEPGKRFYFFTPDNLEIEVVKY